ncbi:6-carboxytetrahydropterin synthase [Alistipes sp. OttesenSCG-928-B03]|nr:6-carboxytetrahydropterin synthase [Alistipes sp. OttesenSCG-928-B03]
MSKVRITKEFSFEMSHVLEGYDGPCSQLHGHSYRLFVTLAGEPNADPADPKFGMVMDFGVLKKLVGELIVGRLDHALMLRTTDAEPAWAAELRRAFERVVSVPFQPTCENLVIWFAELLTPQLPGAVSLHSLRLHETATSFAEWFADDNPGR